MWKICLWLLLGISTLAISPAGAVTITRDDLPSVYQDCSDCYVLYDSAIDLGAMNAFRVVERASNGGMEVNWLLRYSVYLTDPTAHSYMWLHARLSYDLTRDAHPISLLVDQTARPPYSDWPLDADPTDWDFVLTSDALVSGTADYAVQCCGSGTPESGLLPLADPVQPGQSPGPGGLLPCVAEGCEARARLNFVYFMYEPYPGTPTAARLVFDANRTESFLLYSQSSSYDGRDGEPFLIEQNFYVVPTPVTPVPLPASLALLVPALGVLSRFRRRSAP
jgi:hypothetical protein